MKTVWLESILGITAVALVVATMGCSDDDADEGAAGSGGELGSAILLAERVFLPDSRVYYVSVLSEMPTAKLDRTKATELTSADIEVYAGSVYIRDRQSNIITRYDIGADLTLVDKGRFSFQGTGLPTGRIYTAYVSPTLAYALDSPGLRLVGWNPSAMQLTGTEISLAFLKKEGLPDTSLGQPTRVGDRVVVPVSWGDGENLVTNPGTGAMLVIEADPTKVPALVEDPRVGGGYVVWTFDGDAYVGGTVGGDIKLFGTALGGGAVPGSGVVRIKKGATTFDPSYSVDVNALTGTVGVWGIHMVDATHVLAQILDPALDTKTITTPDEFYDSEEFFYMMLDTTSKEWTRQNAIPKGGIGNAQEHVVDGKLYVQVTGAEGAEVHAVTKDGVGPKAFDVPSGDLWFLKRIR